MAAITKENLDERIERIKKRNEEIEKKYREAEEDKLMALKDNALVETKPPKDEDWPKGHKYDKIDFTYDVKPEKLEELKQQRKQEEVKTKRDYKKFPDGEGPPPDPAYNFLADAERDGIANPKVENKIEKRDPRSNNKNKDGNKRGGPNNNSFRGKSGGKGHNPKYQKQNSQPEYDQWRSEREKIDEARISRQKVGDGKWRREWDNEKINTENEALLRQEKNTFGDVINTASKKGSMNPAKHNQSPHFGQNANPNASLFEKRPNITVSVSPGGEVKSVKLTSAPVIGTGRVGPRQLSKPQFSVQTIEKDMIAQQIPKSPRFHNKNNQRNGNFNQMNNQKVPVQNNHVNANPKIQQKILIPQQLSQLPNSGPIAAPPSPIKNKRKPNNPKYIPSKNIIVPDPSIIANPFIAELPIPCANGIIPVDLSFKPEFAKKSVQERLLRVRQADEEMKGKDTENSIKTENTEGDFSPLSSDDKNEEKSEEEKLEDAGTEDVETKCDKTNESIQNIKPIASIEIEPIECN